MEIYLRSIDRRWRKELHEHVAGVLVFSPYITSKTADSVLGLVDEGQCEVYTLFEMDVFASGALQGTPARNGPAHVCALRGRVPGQKDHQRKTKGGGNPPPSQL